MEISEFGPRKPVVIAAAMMSALAAHLFFRIFSDPANLWLGLKVRDIPLVVAMILCGIPLLIDLVTSLWQLQFSSDLLAGLAIVSSFLLGEYLAGSIIVLMLSGGQVLEAYAQGRASSVLRALAKRMPTVAHRKQGSELKDIHAVDLDIGDVVVVFPQEICPVDGIVIEGNGAMDESFLTGEPFVLSKAPGSEVISGAVNQNTALTLRVEKPVEDSRYAKIMEVMRRSEQVRPKMRRLGDRLGAYYTPIAIIIATAAWALSGDPMRFLAVIVVATPCPLLISIPVAIISGISLAARRGIIIKDASVLEKLESVTTAILDKTGTLTYGKPRLTQIMPTGEFTERDVLKAVASLERYSRHPLASAVIESANQQGIMLAEASDVSERPGQGLIGTVLGQQIKVGNRKKLIQAHPELSAVIPEGVAGMECVILINGQFAARMQFRDEPREDGKSFIQHLRDRHRYSKIILASGDRLSEVAYLAQRVGITDVHAGMSPEEKLNLVQQEAKLANTVFLGDGINDAPALAAATVGIGFGQGSEITMEAAGAVILDSSLQRVDELLHISRHMRRIALQSAIGGIALSLICVAFAAAGALAPIGGAIAQEIIDVLAIANSLRAGTAPKSLTDYE